VETKTEPFSKNHYKADIRRLQAAGSAFASKATHFAWRRKVLPSARSKILIVNSTALDGKVLINSELRRIDGHISEKTFMNKTDKLHRAVDDAKNQNTAALENLTVPLGPSSGRPGPLGAFDHAPLL
jgi:hypothetical protein